MIHTGSFKDDKKNGYGNFVIHAIDNPNEVLETTEGIWVEN